jgi:predicted alpha/beta superfamily hydrolase
MNQAILFLRFISAYLFILVLGTPAFSQLEGDDVITGTSVSISSEILGGDVDLMIRLPRAYEFTETSYPVLYDLNGFFCYTYDCGTVELLVRSSDIPDMIVVGLSTLTNGYVPTPYEERGKDLAGADLSLKFFEEELIPLIESNYRTNGYRILYGHSVGGLLTMYALFTQPELFTAYIAGSPWFQTDDQYWLKHIDRMTEKRNVADKFLFMTVGKAESQLTIDTYRELEKWMNGHDLAGLTWQSSWVEGDHGSMVGRNIYDGLLFVFRGWKIPDSVVRNAEIGKIDEYVQKRSAHWSRYGFSRSQIIPESRLNYYGYYLLNTDQYDKAIALFEYNLKLNPESYNAHDSLAEAYMRMGDRENAIKYYRLAVKKNPANSDRARRILESSKEKLRELGEE